MSHTKPLPELPHPDPETIARREKLLADTGLAIAPGIDFDTMRGNSFVRMSFAGPSADIDEALRRLGAWLE